MKKESMEAVAKLLFDLGNSPEGKEDAAIVLVKQGDAIMGGAIGAPLNLMKTLALMITRDSKFREIVLTVASAYKEAEEEVDAHRKEETDSK